VARDLADRAAPVARDLAGRAAPVVERAQVIAADGAERLAARARPLVDAVPDSVHRLPSGTHVLVLK
jgi:hypothetical protein